MDKKFCKSSPHGFHNMEQISEQKILQNDWTRRNEKGSFIKELITYKYYRCTDCKGRWMVKLNPLGKPVDPVLHAQLFVKDFIQPYHADYERVYGKENRDKIINDNKETKEGEEFKQNKRAEIADFKGHYAHGRKWY